MAQVYGDGTNSTVGTQFNTFEWKRKSIIETQDAEYFSQLGDAETLSKHYGQKLKKYHYLPLIDDRNINDQGIDAAGAALLTEVTITIVTGTGEKVYAVGNGVDAAASLTAAQAEAVKEFTRLGVFTTDYATTVAAVEALSPAWTVTEGTAVNASGNLYGSSRNPGYIQGKLPTLSETGGRVNRVGFTRQEVEGQIADYGFFYEWSKDSMDFDTDKELYMHVNRESVRGARKLSEDIVQMDLLSAATVVRYAGAATSMSTLGDSATTTDDVIGYGDLVKLGVTLDNNRCSKDTKAITGSRDTDIKNINAARYLFCGSEMIPTLMAMTDYHGDKAFVEVKNYGNMGSDGKYKDALHGEVGSIAGFRIIVVPEMMDYKGQGAAGSDATVLGDGTNYDVFPMLVVGSGSFAHIRFQVSGSTSDKFKIIVRKPGTFANPDDPYEKIGYSSIQFWQGTLVLRPEWIAKVLTLAKS